MTDEVTPIGKRVYRRKRRWQGATWTPQGASALSEDGIWCPAHRVRHGYMSVLLGLRFEKGSNGKWKKLWYCNTTGNVLQED